MYFPLIADLSFLKSLLPIMQFAHVLVLKSCAEFIVLINMHCASSLWGACFSARSDLFIFMGCSLAKNITAMKGSFNRSWACWFGRWTLPWLNSVVSHDSFLTRSSFAATDSECTHSACQAVARFFGWGLGPGGLPALWLYLWCAQHTSHPHPPWNSSWGLYDL